MRYDTDTFLTIYTDSVGMSFSRTNKMWTLRFIVLMCTLLAICKANSLLTKNNEHNIFICPSPSAITTFLANEPVYEKAGGFLEIKKKIYRFPKEGVNAHKIICISIQDRATDGKGAFPELIAGAYGQYYIEILFTSQRGQPINFNVELYA